MNNEIIFPTDTPIVTKLSNDDKLLIATPDGGLASLPGSALNKVTPITSVEQIAAIRIQKLDGSQHSATPAQIREMVGIDYSKLEEQIVPGEYFVDRAGDRKQLYVRTLRGTYPTEMPQYNVMEIIAPTDHPALLLSIQAIVIAENEIMRCISPEVFLVGKHGGLSQYFDAPEWLGKEYTITIKYTKR